MSATPAKGPPSPVPEQGRSELTLRVFSGVIMATVAIGSAIYGGWLFALIWTGASLAVAFEWQRLVHKEMHGGPFLLAAASVLLAAAGAWLIMPSLLLAALVLAVIAGLLAPRNTGLETVAGVFYAAGLCSAVILCRGQGHDGLIVIFWLFAVVWGTDILAYFTGRTFGGPKLWPSVSPKKTWSGAMGGLVGGVVIGCLLLVLFGVKPALPHIVLSATFSVLTQAGDLFESFLKRRYGVKDSGSLIPGHGGFMDRLDGFIVAVVAAAAFGALRGGYSSVSAGLLQW
ncbi:MAG: phosphatidate cytidylyltransferase [Beijerinckiaceae bacterium]